jgi:hypothetical protein
MKEGGQEFTCKESVKFSLVPHILCKLKLVEYQLIDVTHVFKDFRN